MDTNRLPKQALQYKPKGRRDIGRARKRWRDQLHLEDQGTGNTPNPSGTWWWWWWRCVITQNSAVLIYLAAEAWYQTFSESVRWLAGQQCVRLQERKSSARCRTPEPSQGQNKNISHILSLDYKISDTEARKAGPSETPSLLARCTDL